jgi:hypothetical protein
MCPFVCLYSRFLFVVLKSILCTFVVVTEDDNKFIFILIPE